MRTKLFLGYECKDGRMQINQKEANLVKQIFMWYLEKDSLLGVQKQLESAKILTMNGKPNWTHGGVRRILENECYMGTELYPRLIDDNTFHKVLDLRLQKKEKMGRLKIGDEKKQKRFLDGKIFCGECGQPYKLYAKRGKSKDLEWRCKYAKYQPEEPCGNRIFAENEFIECVRTMVTELKSDSKIYLAKPQKMKKAMTRAERELEEKITKLEVRKKNAVDHKKLIFERAVLTYQNTEIDLYEQHTTKMVEQLLLMDSENWRAVAEEIIKKVEVYHDGKIGIQFINGTERTM
ncbi:MAG: recombinase family protein [Bacillota bacterium]